MYSNTVHCVCVQGLVTINREVATLAQKAREGKLQPHEFQVRTR